ncbi:hypothetical protein EJ03DRAFT_327043 [Teratosphaeria nubilosa]|uniref:Uncharacterized protein n=1 Tax=Teratosphaeria nubilosa TaxID=161662 RepID=A0A6G1LB88_9PEZI|nr:hypothetical protein EJ03DRAFT_327043 [Teratosphaeria nubilosa]
MASVEDSCKLIPAAMNWDGCEEVMVELTKDIVIASNGVVKPLVPLATFSSAYATATGRLIESGEGSMFTMWNGNTVLRVKDQRGDYPLSIRRADVTKISYSKSSPLVIVSAQSSSICDGQFSIEFAGCEHMREFARQFEDLAVKLAKEKFKMFVAEACKEIRVRKAELELAALRDS